MLRGGDAGVDGGGLRLLSPDVVPVNFSCSCVSLHLQLRPIKAGFLESKVKITLGETKNFHFKTIFRVFCPGGKLPEKLSEGIKNIQNDTKMTEMVG